MGDALRAVQHQVSAPQSQNDAPETQLRSQLNIAQGLSELPAAITMVDPCTCADEKDALSFRMAWENLTYSHAQTENFYVQTPTSQIYVSSMFPNVRASLYRAVESQDVVTTAAAIALGVRDLDVDTFTVTGNSS